MVRSHHKLLLCLPLAHALPPLPVPAPCQKPKQLPPLAHKPLFRFPPLLDLCLPLLRALLPRRVSLACPKPVPLALLREVCLLMAAP